MLHKGNPIILKPEEEEVATQWAEMLETDFILKEDVQKNFGREFLELLDSSYGIESLQDLDFKQIHKHCV